MVEISLVIALVAIAAITILAVTGGTISQVFSNVVCAAQGADPSVFPDSPCANFTPSPGGSPSTSASPSSTPSLPGTGGPGRFAYVLNQGDNGGGMGSVTKVDTNTFIPSGSLRVGIYPVGMSITPDGHQIFVLNQGDDPGYGTDGSSSVTVIDTTTGAGSIAATIPVKRSDGTTDAYGVGIFSTATHTYVTSYRGGTGGSNYDGWSIMVIDNSNLSATPTYITWNDVPCGGASYCYENLYSMVFTNSGDTAYVGDPNNYDMTKITGLNGGSPTVDTSYENFNNCNLPPHGNCIEANTLLATSATSGYLLEGYNENFTAIDLPSGVLGTSSNDSTYWSYDLTSVGAQAYFTGNAGLQTVALAGGTPSAITVGSRPEGLAVDSTPGHLWVSNYYDNTVSVVNTSDNSVLADPALPVAVGVRPVKIVIGDGVVGNWVPSFLALSASASDSPTSGHTPLAVSYGATASNGSGSYTYAWDFGDGGTSTAASGIHTYTTVGTFYPTLTVGDGLTTVTPSLSPVTTTPPPVLPLTGHSGGSGNGFVYTISGGLDYYSSDVAGILNKIDAHTGTVVGSVVIGINPRSVGVSPDGSTAYVVNAGVCPTGYYCAPGDAGYTQASVMVIRTSDLTVLHTTTITQDLSLPSYVWGFPETGTPYRSIEPQSSSPYASWHSQLGTSIAVTSSAAYIPTGAQQITGWSVLQVNADGTTSEINWHDDGPVTQYNRSTSPENTWLQWWCTNAVPCDTGGQGRTNLAIPQNLSVAVNGTTLYALSTDGQDVTIIDLTVAPTLPDNYLTDALVEPSEAANGNGGIYPDSVALPFGSPYSVAVSGGHGYFVATDPSFTSTDVFQFDLSTGAVTGSANSLGFRDYNVPTMGVTADGIGYISNSLFGSSYLESQATGSYWISQYPNDYSSISKAMAVSGNALWIATSYNNVEAIDLTTGVNSTFDIALPNNNFDHSISYSLPVAIALG